MHKHSLAYALLADLLYALDPGEYLRSLGYQPYSWQVGVLDAIRMGEKRILITGARQCGKSTITAGIPAYISKHQKALTLIYGPSQEQAEDDIERLKEFIYRDDTYPKLELDSVEHIKLPNGSYIKANTSTAKTKRGKSNPRLIIFDEAAYIEDELYKTIRPMLTDNPDCILIAISTPRAREGWYFKAWESEKWYRILVRAPWEIDNDELVSLDEKAFIRECKKKGIHGFLSDRHREKKFFEEELEVQGSLWFRREYLCEFIEDEDVLFQQTYLQSMVERGKSLEPLIPRQEIVPNREGEFITL